MPAWSSELGEHCLVERLHAGSLNLSQHRGSLERFLCARDWLHLQGKERIRMGSLHNISETGLEVLTVGLVQSSPVSSPHPCIFAE